MAGASAVPSSERTLASSVSSSSRFAVRAKTPAVSLSSSSMLAISVSAWARMRATRAGSLSVCSSAPTCSSKAA